MKRQSEKYRLGILAEMNITPLLDLAFVLLIIFVITSPFLAESSAMAMESGGNAESSDGPNHVVTVSIDATRALFLDGEPVAAANLQDALSERLNAISDGGELGVVVQADRDLAVHDLLFVMGRIKHAGISRVGVVEQTSTAAANTVASSP